MKAIIKSILVLSLMLALEIDNVRSETYRTYYASSTLLVSTGCPEPGEKNGKFYKRCMDFGVKKAKKCMAKGKRLFDCAKECPEEDETTDERELCMLRCIDDEPEAAEEFKQCTNKVVNHMARCEKKYCRKIFDRLR